MDDSNPKYQQYIENIRPYYISHRHIQLSSFCRNRMDVTSSGMLVPLQRIR